MKIQLSDHFTYKKLMRFTLPSIVMMIFTSIYGVVDGLFVSNFAGKTAFAGINFIYPFIMILGAFGFMFGAGGSALISKTMGEGNMRKANRLFSMLTCVSLLTGIVIALLGIIFIYPISVLLGLKGEMLKVCVSYGSILLVAMPAFMLQQEFQSFFITAEKPQIGLIVTVAAGVTNMVLDALFIAVFKWGAVGAGVATAISQVVGGVLPILYFFSKKNDSLLHFMKPKFDGKALWRTCTNGSSELMNNVATSLVGLLYNLQLMKYAGEDGVSAYGVMMYVCFVFMSIFFGYSIGTAPIVGYHYGAKNDAELKNVFRRGMLLMGLFSVGMLLLGELSAYPLSLIFMGYDETVMKMTVNGFFIFSFQFLFCGISIFGSGFFTALNNGGVSALISFLRTLVFQVLAVLLLPLLFEKIGWSPLDGIWVSVVVAEAMSFVITLICFVINRKKYRY